MASPSRATPPCCSFTAATCTLLALRRSQNRTREQLALTASVPCPWRCRLHQHRQSSCSCSRCSLNTVCNLPRAWLSPASLPAGCPLPAVTSPTQAAGPPREQWHVLPHSVTSKSPPCPRVTKAKPPAATTHSNSRWPGKGQLLQHSPSKLRCLGSNCTAKVLC